MKLWYLLDEDKQPYSVPIELYLKLHEDMSMKQTAIDLVDDVRISTVFLGMDHGWNINNNPNYKPILWETMIFGGEHSDYQERYTSHKDALEGHKKALELVNQSLTK